MTESRASAFAGAPEVLLIEDDENDALLFIRAVKAIRSRWDVMHLRNGEEAIAFLEDAIRRRAVPRVIFMDLGLPGMRGADLLDWLQKKSELRATKLFVISSHVKNPVHASLGGERHVWFYPKPTSTFSVAAGLSLESLL